MAQVNGWGPWGPCWRYTCLPSVVCTCAVAVAQWCCARFIQLLRTANRNLRHSQLLLHSSLSRDLASAQERKHSHSTVVDGVTDGRYIARRTGVHHSHTVSISDLENGPSLSRGLTLLAPRVHPWPCRCSSGNRRALQGAAGRPDSVPGPHAASWRTPPQQSATPHSALHAAFNHALATQPSTPGPSFDAPC